MERVGDGNARPPVDFPIPHSPVSPLHDEGATSTIVRVDPSRKGDQRRRVTDAALRHLQFGSADPSAEDRLHDAIATLPKGEWARWTREVFDFDPFECSITENPFTPALKFLRIPQALEEYRALVLAGGIKTPHALLQLFYIMEYIPVLSEAEFETLSERPEFPSLFIETEQMFARGLPNYGLFREGSNGSGLVPSPAHSLFELLLNNSASSFWFEDLFCEILLDDAPGRIKVLKHYHPGVDWDDVATLIGPDYIGTVSEMVERADALECLEHLFNLFGWGDECSFDLFELVESLGEGFKFNIPLAEQVVLTEEVVDKTTGETRVKLKYSSLERFFEKDVTEATKRQFKMLVERFLPNGLATLRSYAYVLVHQRSEYIGLLSPRSQMAIWGAYSIVKLPFIVKITIADAPLWWIRGMIAREYQFGALYVENSDENQANLLLSRLKVDNLRDWMEEVYPDAPPEETARDCLEIATNLVIDFVLSLKGPIVGLDAETLKRELETLFPALPDPVKRKLAELEEKEGA